MLFFLMILFFVPLILGNEQNVKTTIPNGGIYNHFLLMRMNHFCSKVISVVIIIVKMAELVMLLDMEKIETIIVFVEKIIREKDVKKENKVKINDF